MSDWPYTPRDKNEIIEDFEKLLAQKEIELNRKNEKIDNLNEDLDKAKNRFSELEAKLEFATQKISELEEDLISSNAKLSGLLTEKEELLNKIKQANDELSNLSSRNTDLKELIKKKESEGQRTESSESELLINKIKQILTQKGFVSDKEFEKLERGEEI